MSPATRADGADPATRAGGSHLTVRRWTATAIMVAVLVELAVSIRRVEVDGYSMSPVLLPGDRLVVARWRGLVDRWPEPGDIVAVRDPRLSSRILIKRVVAVDRHLGTLEVRGDSRQASTDSREFGPVHRSAVVGRAVYRYAPSGRSGRAPWPEEYHQA